MSETQTAAVIRFTAGPDAGIEFELRDEMVHIGQSLENQIQLTDPTIADHEASIVARNGRFAIYASRDQFVAVDGNPLPSARWIWLPDAAQVSLGTKTIFSFATTGGGSPAPPENGAAPAGSTTKSIPAPVPGERKTRSGRKGAGSRSADGRARKAVARFITDQVGDPLVKLGEDGQLPDLQLIEPGDSSGKRSARTKPEQTSPLLVYGAVGFSFLFSMLLLFVDPELPGQTQRTNAAQARVEIQRFYGTGQSELEGYQLLLREAQLAHSRQDSAQEREAYRAVLKLLQAEDNQGLIRLTDSREHDEELRQLLATLLAASSD